MGLSELTSRIAEHGNALGNIQARVQQLLCAVETTTEEAHQELGRYQELKRAAGQALATAGGQFVSAQRQLRKANELMPDLEAVRAIHVELSKRVNELLAQGGDSPELRQNLRSLMRIRRGLRKTYRRIGRCRRDARLASEECPTSDERSHENDE